MGPNIAHVRRKWLIFKYEMGPQIAHVRRNLSIFKYEMDPKIAPKPIIFQRSNRISAETVHFQIRNGPPNRAFSTKNIDFQTCNERLEKCEPRFKIDHFARKCAIWGPISYLKMSHFRRKYAIWGLISYLKIYHFCPICTILGPISYLKIHNFRRTCAICGPISYLKIDHFR